MDLCSLDVSTRCSRRERSELGSISWARFCSEAKQEVSLESSATCGRIDNEVGACNITYCQTSRILRAARQGKRRAVFEWDIGHCRPERQRGPPFPADDSHCERVACWDGCQVCVFLFSWRPHSLCVGFRVIASTISRISDSITRSSPR